MKHGNLTLHFCVDAHVGRVLDQQPCMLRLVAEHLRIAMQTFQSRKGPEAIATSHLLQNLSTVNHGQVEPDDQFVPPAGRIDPFEEQLSSLVNRDVFSLAVSM